jgi:sugar phosphate isomerase/epimerase
MQIGYPNHPRIDLYQEISWIGRNGFDFVDLFLEEDRGRPVEVDAGRVKGLLRDHGLGVVGHTACYLPIGSPMASLRGTAVSEALAAFEVFAALDVQFVTIHANWPSRMFEAREGLAYQIETLRELIAEAGRRGLRVMYEPLNSDRDSLENVTTILEALRDLWFHLDIGHANLCGRTPEQFIERFADRLRHVHLHDNNGLDDLHLPMGCGKIDWESLVRCLKKHYDGTVTLEVFSPDRDYVLMTKEKFAKMWKAA